MLLVCYVLLYAVASCVKMRYVILCIKRLLIDWLVQQSEQITHLSNQPTSRRRPMEHHACVITGVPKNSEFLPPTPYYQHTNITV